MVLVLLTVPALRDAFSFGPLDPLDWAVAIIAGFASVTWFEMHKLHASR